MYHQHPILTPNKPDNRDPIIPIQIQTGDDIALVYMMLFAIL